MTRKESATRRRVLRTVRDNPGIHKSDLGRRLRLGWGTICYHLSVLAENGEISELERGRRKHIFPASVPERQKPWLAALRDDDRCAVLGALKQRPGSRLTDLSRDLGVSRKVVRAHLTYLDDQGLVRGEGSHRMRYMLDEVTLADVEAILDDLERIG